MTIGAVLLIVLGALGALLLGGWVAGERGALLRSSTREFLREMGWRGMFNGDFLHAYVYMRFTNQYIGSAVRNTFPRTVPKEGERYWADAYHGKVITQDQAEALVSIGEDLRRRDLEQILPYSMARELLLQTPLEIAAYECGCRAAREHPCQPTQVCMVVGQPFVDFVLQHNPRSSRRLTQTEALTLLREEHERGHLHAAYFKDVMLGRFYAICNCCGCCCAGIEAMRDRGAPMVTSSGFVAQSDPDVCQACGTCEDACPFHAITVNGSASVDWEKCMGCGVCEGMCPHDAMRLARDERKGVPLDVRMLAGESAGLSQRVC